ncbi:MAG: hypothetical protein AB7S81_04045 [Bdellovibrionales bacterium]
MDFYVPFLVTYVSDLKHTSIGKEKVALWFYVFALFEEQKSRIMLVFEQVRLFIGLADYKKAAA